MNNNLFLKNLLTLIIFLFCWPSYSGGLIDTSFAVQDAKKLYLSQAGVKEKIVSKSRDQLISILKIESFQKNEHLTFRIVLTAGGDGRRSPLLVWTIKDVKILELKYDLKGDLVESNFITTLGLPTSPVNTCFWVGYMNDKAKAGRACFKINKKNDLLRLRLFYMGINTNFIPWDKKSGPVLTESCPEVHDAAFDDTIPSQWCPWSAVFDGVYNDDMKSKISHEFLF